jgi:hypothetical protein
MAYSVYYTGTGESIKRFDSKREALAYAKRLRRTSRSEIRVRDEARYRKYPDGWRRINPRRVRSNSTTLRNLASVKITRNRDGTVGIVARRNAPKPNAASHPYVVYPSGRPFRTLSVAIEEAREESLEYGKARIENADTGKILSRWSHGLKMAQNRAKRRKR